MRVLHLPTPVGGMAWALAQGERLHGLDSRVLVATQNWIDCQADIQLNLQRTRFGPAKFLRLVKAFLSVRKQFDVFHFNFGRSLIHSPRWRLNQVDLPFYPGTARLFATYNGCDARQKYPTMQRQCVAACHDAQCYGGICNSGKLDQLRRHGIDKMLRFVEHVWVVNPDLLHFFPAGRASFLPYVSTIPDVRPGEEVGKQKRLKIIHAPSERVVKGTRHIQRAVERAQARFPDQIEFKMIEGLPHREALREYADCDLVIDQVLVGWYGGLAVEVMQMGKPVIARIEEADLHLLPKPMADDVRETLISADPVTLEQTLVRLVEDRTWLSERGRASIEFARRWHAPDYVAGLTAAAYQREAKAVSAAA